MVPEVKNQLRHNTVLKIHVDEKTPGRLGKKRTTGLDGFDEFLTSRRGR
jgi:hypothetical protein